MATKSDSKFNPFTRKYNTINAVHTYLQTHYGTIPSDWSNLMRLWNKKTKSGKSLKEQTGSHMSFTVIRVAAVNSDDTNFVQWCRDVHLSVKDPAKREAKLKVFENALTYTPDQGKAPMVKSALPDMDSPVASKPKVNKKPEVSLPPLGEAKTPPAKPAKPVASTNERIDALEGSIAQILALLQNK